MKRKCLDRKTLHKLTYYCVDKDNQINASFKKELYTDEHSNVALVHYLGDDTLALELPHQNATKDGCRFVPASGHVAVGVHFMAQVPPTKVCNDLNLMSCPSLAGVIPQPRNPAAVKYSATKGKARRNVGRKHRRKYQKIA